MSNANINQVRQMLLDTLADLRNRDNPMEIERAKAVATVATVLVDTARVENEYLKITSNVHSEFLEPVSNVQIENHSAHDPFNVTRHRLQG